MIPPHNQIDSTLILTALNQARDAARQIGDLQAAQTRTIRTLETAFEQAVNGPFNDPSKTPLQPQRRTEIRSRIEADPELRTFILARIATLTFDQVIADIAAHFPPARRTTRSSLHRWWHRYGKHAGHPQPPAIS